MSTAGKGLLERFRLDGKVAIVTGASSGLGVDFALGLAEAGADVAVCARRAERLDGVRESVEALGRRCLTTRADVTVVEDCDRVVAETLEALGRVDVLVNNAGVSPQYATLPQVTEELFDKVIAVNLKGPFRLSALVGERMAAGDGGSIINISSTGAVRPTGDIVPYSAAKAGLNALTVGFAHALGPKVRVNAIMPGPFLTTISQAWDMEQLAERTRTFPLRRAGLAEEIVGAALYLAGDASSYTTGSILTVDGGAQWSMPGSGDALIRRR
jgi:NAD(P)-dependent dehydrogenase (short-subunit alcohol dehydrogenase family)